MKISELKKVLNHPSSDRHDDDDIYVLLSQDSIGFRAASALEFGGYGFDWDSGRFFFKSAEPLVVKSENQALWQAARDFIYMLSEDFRWYKGKKRPTELSTSAKEILKLAGIVIAEESNE